MKKLLTYAVFLGMMGTMHLWSQEAKKSNIPDYVTIKAKVSFIDEKGIRTLAKTSFIDEKGDPTLVVAPLLGAPSITSPASGGLTTITTSRLIGEGIWKDEEKNSKNNPPDTSGVIKCFDFRDFGHDIPICTGDFCRNPNHRNSL